MKKIPFITETELDHQLYDFKIIGLTCNLLM